MNEKYIRYLFQLARDEQYPGSMDEFVKRIQTEDNFFKYMLQSARDDQYKGTDEEFSIAIGRTKTQGTQPEPVATEQTAKAEPTTTEPAKVTPQAETQVTETVTAKVEEPVKESVVEEKPTIQVKEVEAPKEEVVKREMPIGENLVPITEKTEVKSVETPSDKLVVKSEKKEKVKKQPKTESKPQMEVKDITKEEPKNLKVKLRDIETVPFEPSKKYKPYGEKGPDVYYYEDYDQYVIKEGDKNIIAKKGSDKYNELDSKIGDSVKRIVENKGKCDPDNNKTGSCSKTQLIAKDFKYYTFDDFNNGYHLGDEGILISQLNSIKKMYDRDNGETLYGHYRDKEDPTRADIFYVDDNLPKDKRFNIYKPYGDDKTLIYDKETGIIFKQLDKKAPDISMRDGKVFNSEGKIAQEAFGTNDERKIYQKYQQENPNEGKTVWYGYENDRPEYKELKSVIEGMDYKKEKGSKNTFVPLTTTPGMQDWSPIPNKK